MADFLNLLRVKQWIKNTFILFPLLFSGKFFQRELFIQCLWTFLAFSLISSGLYIFNDLLDRKKDRWHPKKALRPLARGEFNRPLVIFLIFFLNLGGLFILALLNSSFIYPAILFIGIHVIYNLYTKKIVILDVIFIAFGFHIRIWTGSLAAQVIPSVWLQLCVFLLALFLGFTKRRYELAALKDKAAEHRGVLAHYTSYLLDQVIMICSTLTIVFYGLYTISPEMVMRVGHKNMIYSLVFVIYGIFRYLYLVHVKRLGDDPSDVLTSDLPLLTCVLSWILYVGALIYWPKI